MYDWALEVTMGTRARKTSKRRNPAPGKARMSLRKKIEKLSLSNAELLKLAERYPVPESFWTDDRNPSKP
jgi:hypothetical protein